MYLFGIILLWVACVGLACDIAFGTFFMMAATLCLPLSVIFLVASGLIIKNWKPLLYAVPALLLPLLAFAINGFMA